MDNEQFKKLVLRHDRKYGNLRRTIRNRKLRDEYIAKAPQLAMDFVEELIKMGIDIMIYEYPFKKNKNQLFFVAYLKEYNIFVTTFSGSEHSQGVRKRIFKTIKKKCYPFFLDTAKNDLAWELEKLSNCMNDAKRDPKDGLPNMNLLFDKKIQRKRTKVTKYEKL